MEYMKLDSFQRQGLIEALAGMTHFLRTSFGQLTTNEASRPGAGGSFSPVEQVWHLADLEREGFGRRIQRLRSEANPHLPDFDGDAIAQERNYRLLALEAGLTAFDAARKENIATLMLLAADDWFRSGT